MPWQEVSIMEQRREFVRLAMQEGANRRELCRRFGIHPDTAYKWLERWAGGEKAMADRSRRPHTSPQRTPESIEAQVLSVRDAHPAWGARKIARCLERERISPPAISTVHEILRRNGRIADDHPSPGRAYGRFEKPAPNLLWQMDFKGWVRLWQRSALPSVDDHRRPLTLRAVSQSLCRPAKRHSSKPSDDDLPALRLARCDVRRQWQPLGRCLRQALDAASRLVAEAGHRAHLQQALSSPEPRQERTLPSHPLR